MTEKRIRITLIIKIKMEVKWKLKIKVRFMWVLQARKKLKKKQEHHSKWVQEKVDEDARKKEVLEQIKADRKNYQRTEPSTPSSQPTRQNNTTHSGLPSNISTIATINSTNRHPEPLSQEEELLRLIAKYREQHGMKHSTEHNFGERGRILSQPNPFQQSTTTEYGSHKLEADKSLPTVNIKICLLNNQKVTLVCNLNHTIANIYEHVNYLFPYSLPYLLKMTHPSVVFSDGTVTVEKAQLKNSVIYQEKA